MRKAIALISIIFLGFVSVLAQNAWDEANSLYATGDYENAIRTYKSIEENEGASDELYYNIGNAYYKLNDYANAIIFFRRALKINPRHEDAIFNIKMAKARVKDNIEVENVFFIKSWAIAFVGLQRANIWLIQSAVCFALALLAIIIFLFASAVAARKAGFYSAVVFIFLFCITLACSIAKHYDETNKDDAVITAGSVTLKSSPDQSGTDLFILHAGTEVEIKEQVGEWINIRLANGDMGWTMLQNIERI